jgi:hypothetical protein
MKALNRLTSMSNTKKTRKELRNSSTLQAACEFLYAIGFDEARAMAIPGTRENEMFVNYFSLPDNKNALTILYRKIELASLAGVVGLANPLDFLANNTGENYTTKKGEKGPVALTSTEKSILNVKITEMKILMDFFSELRPERYTPTYFNGANDLKYSKSEFFSLTQTANELNQAGDLRDVYLNPNLKKFNLL